MSQKRQFQWILVTVLAVACASSTGCIGALAQLFYVIKGHEIPAAYSGFEAKRVAIVVRTDSSAYGHDPLADKIERYIAHQLAVNVPDIELVPTLEIDNWIDIHGWGTAAGQLAELGKGVTADYVLGITVDGYSIRDNPTLYQGRSDVTLRVIESATGTVTYSKGPEHFEYPENGRPAIQTNDRKFELFYLGWLTQRMAQPFFSHDSLAEIADDAAFVE